MHLLVFIFDDEHIVQYNTWEYRGMKGLDCYQVVAGQRMPSARADSRLINYSGIVVPWMET